MPLRPIISCAKNPPFAPKPYHAISNIISAMPLEDHPKNYSHLHILISSNSSSMIKPLFLFLYCVLVCVRRRLRCERWRTRRWAVPRASVQGAVPRAGARRLVPRAGLPGRIRRRQVQSHPLMHILSQFYKHNLLTYFTKLHMLLLLKHGWIATPWFVITFPWPPGC